MEKYYTGVGSREAPLEIIEFMKQVAFRMAELGYIGRSGAAAGADSAFYDGWGEHKFQSPTPTPFVEYLPWKGFNGKVSSVTSSVAPFMGNYKQAGDIASTVHPVWDRLGRGAKALHTRNVYQVLGDNLDEPSKVLFCYAIPTKDGVKGGTNTAWQLAKRHNVECFNFYHESDIEEVKRRLKMR